MSRRLKDAKDLETDELIYFKSHAKGTYMSNGTTVEDRIVKIDKFFEEGAKLNLTIGSNQANDSVIGAVKATISYDGNSVEMGSGVIGLPVFTDVTVTFPEVEGYKIPSPLVFTTGAIPIAYSVTYETEVVNVTLSAWDGASVIGQVVTINGTSYTWNGTTIVHKVPYGVDYDVTVSSMQGYLKPEEKFTSSQTNRVVYLSYSAMEGSWITIDQTISDPAAIVSGDVNGEHIQLIRNNSHRYACKYTSEGTMTICQLDDNDSNFYKDGSAAVLNGGDGEIFMKLPKFYYYAIEKRQDVWDIGFCFSDSKPSSKWKEWDGKELIGAYEAGYINDKPTSVSGAGVGGRYVAPIEYKALVHSRGVGYSMIKLKHHNIMCFLSLAMFGKTDITNIIGSGLNSSGGTSGFSDNMGMNDTVAGGNGDNAHTNFWGLEAWFGNVSETMEDVSSVYNTLIVTDGEYSYEYPIPNSSGNYYINKLVIGEDLCALPLQLNATSTNGYCSQCSLYNLGPNATVGRGGSTYKIGIANISRSVDWQATNNQVTSRIAFHGNIIIENDSKKFKSLTAIN